MALHHHQQQQLQTESQQNSSFLLDDDLYCEEERWEDIDQEEEESEINSNINNNYNLYNGTGTNTCLQPLLLLEQDLFWEDEELLSLFSKEQQQKQQTHLNNNNGSLETDSSLSLARCEAVQWMLKVNVHYGFSPLTSILAINYLDRFISSLHFQNEKPWMIQLVAVTCVSLAAKVEETQVPLLLDLQVEETKYVFEAKTIQRMELLVLSTLQWKMNPVTPISFLDHIIRRLGLKTHLHWEFFKRCERLLLSIVSDLRFVRYLPSVLATATMLHVINQVETLNPIEYQNQLLGVLKINKEDVDECYELIFEISNTSDNANKIMDNRKRKYEEIINIPSSPSGVIDGYFSCDSSNDSWVVGSSSSSSSSSSIVFSSFPEQQVFKKNRTQEQQQQQMMMRLSSPMNRVFVEAVGSPP